MSSKPASTILHTSLAQISKGWFVLNTIETFRSVSDWGKTHAFFPSLGAADSRAVTKRVPTQTAWAPIINDAARPRPSKMPPAATSCTGLLVRGERYWRQTSAQAGMRTLVGISPVWPPASPPCAQIRSAPTWQALWTCLRRVSLCLEENYHFKRGLPLDVPPCST